jgi:Spy/CpxP family protein refolding chaperone
MRKMPIWFLFCLVIPSHSSAQEQLFPYAGQQGREIKSLSENEVQGYLAGQGMALAKAAELNHYPGPLHVLELAKQLQLSDAQKMKTEQIRQVMLKQATSLGKSIVEKEKELDALFTGGKIDEAALSATVGEIAQLQGDLRTVHLRAHLEQKEILTPEQVKKYDELRGYASKAAGTKHEGHWENYDSRH